MFKGVALIFAVCLTVGVLPLNPDVSLGNGDGRGHLVAQTAVLIAHAPICPAPRGAPYRSAAAMSASHFPMIVPPRAPRPVSTLTSHRIATHLRV
jgi:hypothetical protein